MRPPTKQNKVDLLGALFFVLSLFFATNIERFNSFSFGWKVIYPAVFALSFCLSVYSSLHLKFLNIGKVTILFLLSIIILIIALSINGINNVSNNQYDSLTLICFCFFISSVLIRFGWLFSENFTGEIF